MLCCHVRYVCGKRPVIALMFPFSCFCILVYQNTPTYSPLGRLSCERRYIKMNSNILKTVSCASWNRIPELYIAVTENVKRFRFGPSLHPFCPLFSHLASRCHWPFHSLLCVEQLSLSLMFPPSPWATTKLNVLSVHPSNQTSLMVVVFISCPDSLSVDSMLITILLYFRTESHFAPLFSVIILCV